MNNNRPGPPHGNSHRHAAAATIIFSARSATGASETGTMIAHILSAENIQPIDNVQHGITVDTVVPRIAAPHGIDRTTEIAFVAQDIVELKRECQILLPQEALRQLRIPHQLVRIHRSVAETAPAVFMQIGGEARSPRRVERNV